MSHEIETRLIHDGEPRSEGAVGVPIFQSRCTAPRSTSTGTTTSWPARPLARAISSATSRHLANLLGGTLDPHVCVLLHRGLKTLALRVRQQGTNALALARFLDGHPAVARVNYPGLESHPRHARARELFDGFGGMLSFETKGGVAAAQRFLGRVRIALHAPSLGGVETLVSRPAAMSHVGMSEEDRAAIGLSDALIRVSVGIEHERDLIDDFGQALS